MIEIEIMKDYRDGKQIMERKTFRNIKDMYKYIIFDILKTYLDKAREDLDEDVFTVLCFNICGFLAEYFRRYK